MGSAEIRKIVTTSGINMFMHVLCVRLLTSVQEMRVQVSRKEIRWRGGMRRQWSRRHMKKKWWRKTGGVGMNTHNVMQPHAMGSLSSFF